jgi:hypothetical protein
MWNPLGYHSWHDTASLVESIGEKFTLEICQLTHPKEVSLIPEGALGSASTLLVKLDLVANYQEADVANALLNCWLMTNFMEYFPPVLAGLNGAFIEVDGVFLRHREQFENCTFSWPMTRGAEFFQIAEWAREGKFRSEHLYSRFNFIDTETGYFTVRNGAFEHLVNYEGCTEEVAKTAIEFAKSLKGYVICWHELPTREEIREFLTIFEGYGQAFVQAANGLFGELSTDFQRRQSQSRSIAKGIGGRPSLTNEILQSLGQTYPDGLNGHSIASVARKLGYDRKTLRGALIKGGLITPKD